MERDIKGRRAFRIAYGQRLLTFAISLVSTASLARLLNPEQFGFAAMATTAMNFLLVFRDFGLTSTTIQRQTLSVAERDSLFWMNAGIVTLISLVAVAVAPLLGMFYGQPIVTSLMFLAAGGFFISGLSAQHAAVLRRELDFGKIFIAEVGGALVGTLSAIVLAYALRSAYALIIASLIQAAFTTVAAFLLGGWIPKLHAKFKDDLHMLGFGSSVAAYTAMNFGTNNVAAVMLGAYRSSTDVGFYNRAQSLYELPRSFILGPYLQIQFIMLCKDAADPIASRQRYVSIIELTSILFIPAACVLPVVSRDLVEMLLGGQWGESSEILSWMTPAMASLGVVGAFGQYLTSRGSVSALRNWGVFDFLIRGGGTILGSFFGPDEAAAGFGLSTLLIATPIQMAICARITPVSIKDQVNACVPGLMAGLVSMLCALGASYFSIHAFPSKHSLRAAFAILAALLGWLIVLALNERSRTTLSALIKKDTLADPEPIES